MSIKVLKTTFTASSEDIDRLFACNRISAMIWNETLRLAKEYSLSNGGKWAGKSYLQEQTKNRYPLQSQSVQSVVHRYLFARDGARAAISKGYKNKYPWRHKNHYNTRWVDKAFDFDFIKNILSLSLGIWDHKKQKPILVMLPKDTVGKLKELLEKNKNAVSEIELCYNNGLRLHITYDDGVKAEEKLNDIGNMFGGIRKNLTYCINITKAPNITKAIKAKSSNNICFSCYEKNSSFPYNYNNECNCKSKLNTLFHYYFFFL